jgi:hypothetical protein
MKNTVVACFLAALLVAGAGCSGGGGGGEKTVRSGKPFRGGGLSFRYPAEWRERTPGLGEETSGIAYQVKVGPPGRAQDFVGITVAPIGVRIKGKDLAITEENIDERKGLAVMGVEFLVSLGGGELSEPTRVSVGGLPGFRWKASHVKVRRDGRVDLLLTEVFKGTTSYTVSCGYTPEGAAEVKAACDQVLDSFRVEPGGGAANSTGAVLFSDDFSNKRSGWDVGGNRDRSMAYVNGRYRIAIRKSMYGPSVSHDLDHPSKAISVTAVLRQSAGGRGDGLGVACVSKRPTVGYELLIGPRDRGSDTANMVVKTFREQKKPDALTWGDDEAVKPRGAVNRIRVDCVGASARTPARLTLYANGKLILQATDPRGYKRFEAIGLYAWSNAGGTTALFDDLVVRELKRAG